MTGLFDLHAVDSPTAWFRAADLWATLDHGDAVTEWTERVSGLTTTVTGTPRYDAGGYHDQTPNGMPAVVMRGLDDLRVSDDSAIHTGNQTIGLCFYLTDDPRADNSTSQWLTMIDSTNPATLGANIGPTGELRMQHRTAAAPGTSVVTNADVSFGPDVHTLFLRSDGTNCQMFVDGRLVATAASGVIDTAGAGPWVIGGHSTNDHNPEAALHEAALWDSALTDDQIASIHEGWRSSYIDTQNLVYGGVVVDPADLSFTSVATVQRVRSPQVVEVDGTLHLFVTIGEGSIYRGIAHATASYDRPDTWDWDADLLILGPATDPGDGSLYNPAGVAVAYHPTSGWLFLLDSQFDGNIRRYTGSSLASLSGGETVLAAGADYYRHPGVLIDGDTILVDVDVREDNATDDAGDMELWTCSVSDWAANGTLTLSGVTVSPGTGRWDETDVGRGERIIVGGRHYLLYDGFDDNLDTRQVASSLNRQYPHSLGIVVADQAAGPFTPHGRQPVASFSIGDEPRAGQISDGCWYPTRLGPPVIYVTGALRGASLADGHITKFYIRDGYIPGLEEYNREPARLAAIESRTAAEALPSAAQTAAEVVVEMVGDSHTPGSPGTYDPDKLLYPLWNESATTVSRLTSARAAKLDSLLDSGTVAAAGATNTDLDDIEVGTGGITGNPYEPDDVAQELTFVLESTRGAAAGIVRRKLRLPAAGGCRFALDFRRLASQRLDEVTGVTIASLDSEGADAGWTAVPYNTSWDGGVWDTTAVVKLTGYEAGDTGTVTVVVRERNAPADETVSGQIEVEFY